jgi:hypothetical protein
MLLLLLLPARAGMHLAVRRSRVVEASARAPTPSLLVWAVLLVNDFAVAA